MEEEKNVHRIIGIDLGTTNSLVAVWEDGQSRLIPNAFGEYLTPSVVSFDEDGTVYVGRVAVERQITHPENTVSVFKRFMGMDKEYEVAGKKYRPEDLSALVLRKLKEDAENYLQQEVTEAIISVPAYFNDLARNATKTAGELAGFRVERIINEPSAAALAYHQHNSTEEETILVFDMGGGTLDVSLVDCAENIVEILAVSGDNGLGGSDFDQLIADAFITKHGLEALGLTMEERAIILDRAVRCKTDLTKREQSTMRVTMRGKTHTMKMTRVALIHLAEQLFIRMSAPVQKVVKDAGKEMREIDGVVLVGGSCKMPVVQKYIEHSLGRKDLMVVNPDHMVALGLGIYAGIKERNEDIKDMILTDICPFSLGIGVYNKVDPERHLMRVLIERNTALPTSRVVMLQTVTDNQKQIEVEICQGEAYYLDENLFLGKIEVDVPQAPKGEEKISVRYTYDINGILVVDVLVLSTGESQQVIIRNEKIQLTQKELERKLIELEKLKISPREKDENRFTLARAERLYEETTGSMRDELAERTRYFDYLLDKQDEYAIDRWRVQFNHYLDQIENYLQLTDITAHSIDEFSSWFASEEQMEDNADWQVEENSYQSWKNEYWTS